MFKAIPFLFLGLILPLPAVTAEINELGNRDGVLHFSISGEIETGDLNRLKAKLDALPDSPVTLHLSSPGGSYGEAIEFIRYIVGASKRIGTAIDSGDSCFSACAFIFMAGRGASEDGFQPPIRHLSPKGSLGFHAPYLEVDVPSPSKQLIETAYDVAVGHIADLVELAKDLRLSPSELHRILKHGRNSFLTIDTVDKLGRFRIEVPSKNPKKYTVEMLNNVCANAYAWREHSPSTPQKNNPINNDLLSWQELQSGLKPTIQFRSQILRSQAGQRLRYAIPSSEGPEGTTETCIIDVYEDDGQPSFNCVGFEFGFEENKAIWSEDFRPQKNCGDELYSYSVAPPNTPLGEIETAVRLLEGRAALWYTSAARPNRDDIARTPTSLSAIRDHDMHGGDYDRLKDVPLATCNYRCESDARCKAYSYDKWNSWCFLKDTILPLNFDPQSDSYIRAPTASASFHTSAVKLVAMPDRNIADTEPYTHGRVNRQSCFDTCARQKRCVGLSFEAATSRCNLFDRANGIKRQNGVVSGVKRQPPNR